MKFGDGRGFCGRDPMEYPICTNYVFAVPVTNIPAKASDVRRIIVISYGAITMSHPVRSNGYSRINEPLSILQVSFSNCDVYTLFFFQSIVHEILYKSLVKRALPTNSYEVIFDKHYNAIKWPTFKCTFLSN